MATSFVSNSSDSGGVGTSSLSPAVPAGVQDDDLLLGFVKLSTSQVPNTVPSGWTLIASENKSHIYYKVASSESGTYTWGWATSCPSRVDVAAYRSGFNISDPIDAVSNTAYTTNDTTLRAASFNVSDTNETLIFIGHAYDTVTPKTFSPPSNPGVFTEDVDDGDALSDFYNTFAHYQWSGSGATGNIDATISSAEATKHAFCISLNPEVPPNYFTAASEFSVPEGGATFENSNDFTAAGDLPVPTGSALFENTSNYFTAACDFPLPDGEATFTQKNPFNANGDLPVPVSSGIFENLPNYFTAAAEFPVSNSAASFEQVNNMLADASFPMPTSDGEFEGYHDPVFIEGAYAIYGMDAFGNDTDTPAIWERSDSDLDLTPGDGVTAGTFPTFTDEGDGVAYYSFDGVDDYLSGWPSMPAEYTVIMAYSTSYPGGQPAIQYCNDTTIKALLTNAGSFTGNVHSMLVFDWELLPSSLTSCERMMLKRLWRDTFVDPFTARKIRESDCELCLYCEEQADCFDDYSLNAIGYTDYSTVWNAGLTFPVAGAAVVMDADAELNTDKLTIFLEAPDFDLEATAETILQNGTNYVLSIALATGTCTLTLNGSDFAFAAAGYRTLCVTARDGQAPKFYLNGKYAGDGDAVATVSAAGAGQLTIGNNTAKNNPFASTLKKLTIYSKVLTAGEIRAAHFGAMAERTWS